MERVLKILYKSGKNEGGEQEVRERRQVEISNRVLNYFRDPGVIKTSVPVQLVNSEGEVIYTIKPN